MILIDPDLEPDGAFPAFVAKRASSIRPTHQDRGFRLPSARTLGLFLRHAQAAVCLCGQVSVLLTTDGKIRRLNRQFRGKDKTTDVLSFPALEGEVAGDLAISVPTARRQACEQGHTLSTEIKVLMLHGLLHLAGFDHERDKGEMARRERLLRGRLGLPQGLIERVAHPTLATTKSREDGARRVRGGHTSQKKVLRSPRPQDDKSVRRRRKA